MTKSSMRCNRGFFCAIRSHKHENDSINDYFGNLYPSTKYSCVRCKRHTHELISLYKQVDKSSSHKLCIKSILDIIDHMFKSLSFHRESATDIMFLFCQTLNTRNGQLFLNDHSALHFYIKQRVFEPIQNLEDENNRFYMLKNIIDLHLDTYHEYLMHCFTLTQNIENKSIFCEFDKTVVDSHNMMSEVMAFL